MCKKTCQNQHTTCEQYMMFLFLKSWIKRIWLNMYVMNDFHVYLCHCRGRGVQPQSETYRLVHEMDSQGQSRLPHKDVSDL